MAGIGFRLEKILSEGTYLSTLKGYFYAAIISSGPWLLSILCIGGLGILSRFFLNTSERELFGVLVVYSYAFSLIVTGPFQIVVTRYLSDRLYSEDREAVLHTYLSIIAFVSLIQAVIGGVCYSFLDLDLKFKIIGYLLFIIVSNIWIAMIFISALQGYMHIVLSFAIGMGISLGAGLLLSAYKGLIGILEGYTLGQAVIFLMLTWRVFCEFPYKKSARGEPLSYFKIFPQLAFIGLFYNGAIWIDKFIFWFSTPGKKIFGFFSACPIYDTAMYITYLSIVPSMSLFIITIETKFYTSYKDFYGAIVKKLPIDVIERKKEDLVHIIYKSIRQVLTLQGLITITLIALAPKIVVLLKFEWRQLAILQIGTLGTFLHVLLMLLNIFVLYFDFRNLSLEIAILFFLTNTLFTWLSIQLGFQFYGYGYMVSCLLVLIIGFFRFLHKLKDLEYLTFMQQPIVSNK